MIVQVKNRNRLKEFVNLPQRLYKKDGNWVRPLVGVNPGEFNPSTNPALKYQVSELYLMMEGTQPIGRVAAFIDRRYNLMHNEQAAFFGFFECINSRTAARQLLSAAEGFAAAKGASKIIGPVDFNTNYQAGLLVEGFSRPSVMTPYNHRYYCRLLEANGYKKSVDLFAYRFLKGMPIPDRAVRVAKIIPQRHPEITIRPFGSIPNRNTAALLESLYNQAFAGNWGFVPMTSAEFSYLLKTLASLGHTDLNYIAFAGAKPIGLLLSVPDLYAPGNGPYFSDNGTKTPAFKDLRITVIGVIPAYRRKGVEAALGVRALQDARAKGYETIEFSVILENNTPMNNIVKREFGLAPAKTYRVYEKNLSGPIPGSSDVPI